MVKILYFAGLREQTGCGSEEFQLPPEVRDIASLRAALRARGGAWADAPGATKNTANYTIVSADAGNCLRLSVTATNSFGTGTAAVSASRPCRHWVEGGAGRETHWRCTSIGGS